MLRNWLCKYIKTEKRHITERVRKRDITERVTVNALRMVI